MAIPTVVQSAGATARTGDPTAWPSLGSNPTAGNLIVALVFANSSSSSPASGSGWTRDNFTPGTGNTGAIYFRYAVGGDTGTYPSPENASLNGAFVAEIAGVSGAWVHDQDGTSIADASGSSTSPIFTTTNNDVLVLAAIGSGGAFAPSPTITSPWTQDQSHAAFDYAAGGADQGVATAGTGVSAIWVANGGTHLMVGILLGTGGSTETGNVTMAFGAGIAINATADKADEVGNITMAFSGTMAMNVDAFRADEVGNVTLALDGIGITAVGYLPGPAGTGLRQFWTFGN